MNQAARTSTLGVGQVLHGKYDTYSVIEQVRGDCPNIWRAQTSHQPLKNVILKSARSDHFEHEVTTLELLRGHNSFRQLVDVIEDRPVVVLEYLDDNIQHAVNMRPKRKLDGLEVKAVAKVVLEGLSSMHQMNMAHTDIKPDNILINYDDGETRFSNPKVCDLGGSVQVQSTTNSVIGHAAYRAPEVNLGLTWTTAVDIWSFGATLMYLFNGAHFFYPPSIDEADDTFLTRVLINQFGFFGPCHENYAEIAGSVMPEVDALQQDVANSGMGKRYRNTLSHYLSEEDLNFLLCFMKIDPRDRPSASELLQHSWFGTQGLESPGPKLECPSARTQGHD